MASADVRAGAAAGAPQHKLSAARIVKDKASRQSRGWNRRKSPDTSRSGGGLDLADQRRM